MVSSVSGLTKTQKLRNDSGGFLLDDPKEPGLGGRPRPPVSATDSGRNERDEIEEYIEALKRRAQESNRAGGSSTQEKSAILHRPELWMLPVPVHFFHVVLMMG